MEIVNGLNFSYCGLDRRNDRLYRLGLFSIGDQHQVAQENLQ